MAINGTDSTFLTMESGNIQIISSSQVGGIYLRKGITFNRAYVTLQRARLGNGHHGAVQTARLLLSERWNDT